jgi:DNA-directed RNA polymerase specialized sigma24 family protein
VADGGVPMTLATPDDGQSADSVERLFRLHGAWLLDFLNRRFGALIGEEAAQEAFVRTLASRTRIRNPRAFLAKVAIRAALEEVRRRPAPRLLVEPVHLSAHPDAEMAILLEQTILSLPEPTGGCVGRLFDAALSPRL